MFINSNLIHDSPVRDISENVSTVYNESVCELNESVLVLVW